MIFSYGRTQNPNCPSPEAFIIVSNPDDSAKKITIPAIVDSSAVMTCIPESTVKHLGSLSYSTIRVRDVNNNIRERKTYYVNIQLGDYPTPFKQIEVVATPKDYALIGRDILNQLIVVLDAPNEVWFIAQSRDNLKKIIEDNQL